MKKFLIGLFMVIVCFALVACGPGEGIIVIHDDVNIVSIDPLLDYYSDLNQFKDGIDMYVYEQDGKDYAVLLGNITKVKTVEEVEKVQDEMSCPLELMTQLLATFPNELKQNTKVNLISNPVTQEELNYKKYTTEEENKLKEIRTDLGLSENNPSGTSVESISISPHPYGTTFTGYVGEQKQLTANILPSNATYSYLFWLSSDPSIVAIDQKGLLTFKKVGLVTITLIVDGLTSTMQVISKDSESSDSITDVTINYERDQISGHPGDKVKLDYAYKPNNVLYKSLTWSSSNINVATVTNDGVVELVREGSAIITLNIDGIVDSIPVTVTENDRLYKLIIFDDYGLINNIEELQISSFMEDSLIDISLSFKSSLKVGLIIDGDAQSIKYTGKVQHVTFNMPSHNVIIKTTVNGFCSTDSYTLSDIPATSHGFNSNQIDEVKKWIKSSGSTSSTIETLSDYSRLWNVLIKHTYNEISSLPTGYEENKSAYYEFSFTTKEPNAIVSYKDGYIYIETTDDTSYTRYFKSFEELPNDILLSHAFDDIIELSHVSISKLTVSVDCHQSFMGPVEYIITDSNYINGIVNKMENATAVINFDKPTGNNAFTYSFVFTLDNNKTISISYVVGSIKYGNYYYTSNLNINSYLLDEFKTPKAYYNSKEVVSNEIRITVKDEYTFRGLYLTDFGSINITKLNRIFDIFNPTKCVYSVTIEGYDKFKIEEAIDLINSLKLEYIEKIEPVYWNSSSYFILEE